MHRSARFLASVALSAAVAAAVAGCASTGSSQWPESSGPFASAPAPRTEADWRKEMETWGARYRAKPSDAEAAARYAQALRAIGQRAQAAAVLENATIRNPQDQSLLGAYGRALADNGNYSQALEVLNRAHSPDNPDWRILSVQGAVLDQMGRHADAQRHYASALRLVPDEPSVLSNLGLSYALSKQLPLAETTLRRAADMPDAAPKVRQNLALVIGLQGRFQEAEEIARADLSPEDAQANLAYLRRMLADENGKKAKPPSRPLRQAANNS
jgi:Flp pilus assembly protein TadD